MILGIGSMVQFGRIIIFFSLYDVNLHLIETRLQINNE
jgi:hypothetical protein